MAYSPRKPIRWGELLAHPRDLAQARAAAKTKAHAVAWAESSNERDGRVCILTHEGLVEMAYDHRATLINETAPDKATLRRQAHQARQNRAQVITPQGNRHISGS